MGSYPLLNIAPGTYTYTAFASSNTGSDFSTVRYTDDEITRCYHAIYISDVALDLNTPEAQALFLNRWFNICCECDPSPTLPTIAFYMRALSTFPGESIFPLTLTYNSTTYELQNDGWSTDYDFRIAMMDMFNQIAGITVVPYNTFPDKDDVFKVTLDFNILGSEFNFIFSNYAIYNIGFYHFGKIKYNNDNTILFDYKFGEDINSASTISTGKWYDLLYDNIILLDNWDIIKLTE